MLVTKIMLFIFSKQAGFNLIEVLLGLLMFSVVLLGLARIGIIALRHNQAAYLLSVAEVELSGIIECLQSTHATLQCKQQQQLATRLPKGKASVHLNSGHYQITISWKDAILEKDISHCELPNGYHCLIVSGHL